MVRRALLVCPKPLDSQLVRANCKMWAPDLPFEVIDGDPDLRRTTWLVSNCPLKLVNYEVLTRDAESSPTTRVHFDVVVLDEAQRIKNTRVEDGPGGARRSAAARSWALTGTPIENHADDLVNIFAFVDPGRIPPDTPAEAARRH